ncbi:phage portal protein [Brevibacillus agri]|uniref:phage portal protein n=1 Tax=Brevibacillus agri TaxID=51101 RepID=UPI0018CC8C7C|nr:phage portal protein [Brevibacillus agri]MBG9567559.1 phage portal protein [Brevibacillus agri]MBG9567598.1 phage portal protein [Brevibacillus agri]MED1642305.1 phage portal protein [Brevibacillus agri]MED1657714.1 phage portal protein [Brevibacillus agri]MED1689471.1 phage portal protein [Brevibacillus agri]
MSRRRSQRVRQPTEQRGVQGAENALLGYWLKGDDLSLPAGYVKLSDNPEVRMAVDRIADLVSNMTIHLMRNVNGGHERVQNELSRKVDIEPYSLMTRKTWLYFIVHTLLLEGDGNAVVFPQVREGLIDELIPVPADMVAFSPPTQNGIGLALDYQITIQGRAYNHDEVLHFRINPDPRQPWLGRGYRLILKDIVGNLQQAAKTKKAFMGDKWRPGVIVMVDADTSQFSSDEERDKLIQRYIGSGDSGKPWILPEGIIRVETVKPLSLQDIAIHESVNIDKRTVAAMLGVPPFFVGVGEFKKDEVNNFIRTRIASIATTIGQELTSKLLYSPELYFRLSARSLYAYDLKELAEIGESLYVRGLMDGNEVRDWVGLSPREGLDELVILENYIPRGMIGDQKKLNQEGGDDG